jgi:hypothetical protein
MQAFYTNLSKVAVPGEMAVGLPAQALQPRAAAGLHQKLHQELLRRLTQVTLSELQDHDSNFGWQPWW